MPSFVMATYLTQMVVDLDLNSGSLPLSVDEYRVSVSLIPRAARRSNHQRQDLLLLPIRALVVDSG
jgi:hypothetical protein